MASTPAKHRYGADHAPERRTPLGHKRINQSASAATSLSYLLQDLQLKDEATPSRKLLSDKGSNKHDPARRQSPERREKNEYARSRLHHLIYPSFHITHTKDITADRYPTQIQVKHIHLRRIITARDSINDKRLAEAYCKAATEAASQAAARSIGCRFAPATMNPHRPPVSSPLGPYPTLPPTPIPKAGSSPFVKAQRRIHHIRYGSVEVRGKARTLRETLLRKRAAV